MGCRAVAERHGGQFGSAGHLGQPLLPPIPVTLVRGGIGLTLGAIAPVAVAGRRQRHPVIRRGQLGSQHPIAQRVAGQHIGVQMQPAALLVPQGQRDIDDLAVFNSQALVSFTFTQLRQCGFHGVRTLSAQVDHAEDRSARLGHRLLCPVRQESGT